MKRHHYLVLFIISTLYCSCVHKADTTVDADGGYPADVAKIMITKCASAGCHNQASYGNADSLLLDTWDHCFNGGVNGAAVVAYNAQFSPLMYFVNTDSSLGPIALPTMPFSTPTRPMAPLTKAEYMTLYNWIQAGAPDKNGNIPFASDADTRQKIYLTQQGCDLLAVIDAQRKVVMRYINIGANPEQIESPHCVRISHDGRYAYTSFLAGNYVQKIDTRTDQVVSAVNVGALVPGGTGGSWNIVHVLPGDTALLTSNWSGDGFVAGINAVSMTTSRRSIYGQGTFFYPHGIESTAAGDTFYTTAQYSNLIYKMSIDGTYYKEVSLDGNPPHASTDSSGNTPNPHEILMTPDFSKYFVTCQGTNKVTVMDPHTDAILAAIPVGVYPQELAVSTTRPYMFVTCQEDASTLAHAKGSVYVINYNTYQVVAVLYGDFYQPHGITVDDKNGVIYVASTNANPNGPAPHHATACSGRDGWYTLYDLNTLQPLNSRRYEVTVMPYSAAVRFK